MVTVEEKLKKAKVQLQMRNSFFGRLILAINFIEDKNVETMCVDYKINCYYNPKFVEDMSLQELIGLVAHEIFHVILLHHFRFAGREPQISNIAEDICINSMLVRDKYTLPKAKFTNDKGEEERVNGLLPDYNDRIELNFGGVGKIVIEECSTKSAEMIYEEIIRNLKQRGENISMGSDGIVSLDLDKAVKEIAKRLLDEHRKAKNEKVSKKELREAQKKVEGLVREALEYSRMRGDVPLGLELMWGDLHKEKFNWKTLLQRYISEMLPYDQSWHKFGKRTYGTGVYTPTVLREQIDVCVAIDLSGSINKKDLTNFVSEIVGVANQFKNRIKMKILTHETEVIDEFNVFNENDIKSIKIRGGGGTSFQPVVDYVNKNNRETKCLIWLTDGEGEKEIDKQHYKIIWVLTEDGSDKLLNRSGHVLWLKDTVEDYK